jgi:hypothetical protein
MPRICRRTASWRHIRLLCLQDDEVSLIQSTLINVLRFIEWFYLRLWVRLRVRLFDFLRCILRFVRLPPGCSRALFNAH